VLSCAAESLYEYNPQDLLDWAVDNGASIAVRVGEFTRDAPHGNATFPIRGLAAARPFKAGEVIIEVPLNLTISEYTVENDINLRESIGLDWQDYLGDDETDFAFGQHEMTYFNILYQRSLGPSGKLWPYIKSVLSADFSRYPTMMTPAELEYHFPKKQFHEIYDLLEYDKRRANMYLKTVVPKLKAINGDVWTDDVLNFETIMWALQVEHGRGWEDTAPYLDKLYFGEKRRNSHWNYYVPVFEWLNYPKDKGQMGCVTCSARDDEDEGKFRCFAQCDFEEGDEVTLYYGDGYGIEMLYYHGFRSHLHADWSDACLLHNICERPRLAEGDKRRNVSSLWCAMWDDPSFEVAM
jgi:hypothetical protein